MISKIRKRNGRIADFNPDKIRNAVYRASLDTGKEKLHAKHIAEGVSDEVILRIESKYKNHIPSVESVQDVIEDVLMGKHRDIAKAYIIYRQRRREVREAKSILGVKDDLKLGLNAIKVLKDRYLLRDGSGNAVETPSGMLRRVARAIASVEKKYSKPEKYVKDLEEKFYSMMAKMEFLPNSPTLMNAGTEISQLSACFVLPVEDSMESIFEAVKRMAIVQKSGGGTVFNFSGLRPEGDAVRSTMGAASGPVSFMRVFDTATEVTRQGGRRRGANMGLLRYNHPDIAKFIGAKADEGVLKNFNLSVSVDDGFMENAVKKREYSLINPRSKKPVGKQNAGQVFDLIVSNAWQHGDPGLIFLDAINRGNPTPQWRMEATNPCAEQPLLCYESCNLGSINLSKMVRAENKKTEIDWNRLKETVRLAVRFLDNVIDANRYPLVQTEKITKANRKIGLGVMGFAELLMQLGIQYDSVKAIRTAENIMKFVTENARKESEALGKERGNFPNKQKSVYKNRGHMRNATVTTIAPTGSISLIAGCSSGIEPLFAVSFVRNVLNGAKLVEVNRYFEKIAKERKFYSKDMMMQIARTGTVQHMRKIPEDVKRIFRTALDITPEWHVRIQAAFQKHTDNAVSKTINLPETSTPLDVKNAFLLAWKLGCKGITVYRYGSRREQALRMGMDEEHITAEPEYSGGCPKKPYCEV